MGSSSAMGSTPYCFSKKKSCKRTNQLLSKGKKRQKYTINLCSSPVQFIIIPVVRNLLYKTPICAIVWFSEINATIIFLHIILNYFEIVTNIKFRQEDFVLCGIIISVIYSTNAKPRCFIIVKFIFFRGIK